MRLLLHSHNGGLKESSSMLGAMHNLVVMSSFNRPTVSKVNAYAESIFRIYLYALNTAALASGI
ncbi:hypothetical protein [Teredinibacter turnerae]|uniref:hypothetical protein n=1 Tax=Teredinibacter turnerae TaxID=2426 RepID=UPI0012BCFC6D|nr:hypothetical protein [Teredinibacter turnerae]